ARELAGFTPAEADDLRKAVGKKIASLMASLKDKFIAGCEANGVSPAVARQLWDDNERSADYSFNKSHAACYALVSYRTAWLKANHPAEYMAALLSSVMSTKDRVPFYVAECVDMGIEVLPPDVNESQSDFAVVDGKVRFGLTAVKNVGEGAVRAVVVARDRSPVTSVWDFCERVDGSVLNRKMLESLIACGALDSTGATRRGMTEVLEQALGAGQKSQADALLGQGSIFDMGGDDPETAVPRSHPPVPAEEWPRDELLRREKEVLGLYVSSHPLTPLRAQLQRRVDVQLRDAASLRDGQALTIGGIVAGVRQQVTKRGETMAFVELDDATGTLELLVFAKSWLTLREVLLPDAIVLVRGRLERRSESELRMIATEATAFAAVPDQGVVKLRVDGRRVSAEVVAELRTLIGEYPGEAPVELEVDTAGGQRTLRFGSSFRVRPDGDFFAEARALLGDAALV
ncbi:MAG TPA: OB-fold nucleic acid binding domain-containing protein, partial [Gaiellales bacterium]|nr:OB-fold nucleic acid binding domain-containing protein [Gaiellales bacterium]